MTTTSMKSQDSELLIAALLVMFTNWDNTETREGRRGKYHTTGASQLPRMKTIPKDIKSNLISIANSIGMDIEEEEIDELFSGLHEYQLSFAINRFESRTGDGISLTSREQKAVQTVVELLARKPEAVTEKLPELLRKAG